MQNNTILKIKDNLDGFEFVEIRVILPKGREKVLYFDRRENILLPFDFILLFDIVSHETEEGTLKLYVKEITE